MGPYCFAAYFGYAVLFIALQQLIGRHRGATNTKKREAPGFYLFSLISIGFLLASTSSISHQPVRNVPLIIGGAIVFVGLGISMWSQWELGSNWVGGIGLHKKHQLITSGPYRFVRHPLYSGMLVSAIGLGIFGWNIFFLLSALSFSGAYTIRLIGEEQELKKRFPKQYPRYAARTGMFVPRIRKRN